MCSTPKANSPHLIHVYPITTLYPISSTCVCTCVWGNLMMIVYSHGILSTCLWSICYHESCVHVCVGQRRVMQYSTMDQTLDSINELCLCSRRSLIHEICSYDIFRVEKRYFGLPIGQLIMILCTTAHVCTYILLWKCFHSWWFYYSYLSHGSWIIS